MGRRTGQQENGYSECKKASFMNKKMIARFKIYSEHNESINFINEIFRQANQHFLRRQVDVPLKGSLYPEISETPINSFPQALSLLGASERSCYNFLILEFKIGRKKYHIDYNLNCGFQFRHMEGDYETADIPNDKNTKVLNANSIQEALYLGLGYLELSDDMKIKWMIPPEGQIFLEFIRRNTTSNDSFKDSETHILKPEANEEGFTKTSGHLPFRCILSLSWDGSIGGEWYPEQDSLVEFELRELDHSLISGILQAKLISTNALNRRNNVKGELSLQILQGDHLIRTYHVNSKGELEGDDGGGWETCNDDLEWDQVKGSFGPEYVTIVEMVQFERIYNEKSVNKDWKSILEESKKFESSLKNRAKFWSIIGNSHRELNEHKEAALAYTRSLSIDPNDSQVIARLGSSYFLLGVNNYFYDWINNNFESLDPDTQEKVITNLETNWKGYLDYKSLCTSILAEITKWRTKMENDVSKALEDIKIKINSETRLLYVLQSCLKEKKIELIPGVLALNLLVDENEIQEVAQLLTNLLDNGKIKFEDVPDHLKSEIIEISALKAMKGE